MEETWKPIYGFEKKYEISSYGRVKSLARQINNKNICERILKSQNRGNGYLGATLSHARNVKFHRLVAEHFLPVIPGKTEINHVDGNKNNNNLNNLEWVTNRENTDHAIKMGLRKNKLSKKDVLDIRNKYLPRKYTLNKLALEYGVCQASISFIIKKINWKHV